MFLTSAADLWERLKILLAFIAPALIVIVYFGYSLYRSRKDLARRGVEEQLRAGSLQHSLGHAELEIAGGTLTGRLGAQTNIWHDLASFDKIVEADTITMVFVTPRNAIVIPRRDVAEDDYEQFMAELRAAIKGKPAEPDTRIADLER